MRISWFNLVLTSFLLAMLFLSYSYIEVPGTAEEQSSQKELTTEDRTLPQVVQSVSLNKDFYFAGERMPLETADVRERLEKELLVNSYRHSSTLGYLKLMPRYFPLIENILRQEGLPDDFKYLAVAESGLEQAVSPSGAKGIWQFLKGTAIEQGLMVSNEIDERYHVEKSTRAACRYLKQLHERFGSWTLAAAAYNMGFSALSKDLDLQKESSYYNMNLSRETMRYIFRIVALKEVHQNTNQYGYYMQPTDYYAPMDNVQVVPVESSVESLADLAHEHGASYRDLKVYNPWLLDHRLVNSAKKTYYIQLPRK
jgi:hypothetical protein